MPMEKSIMALFFLVVDQSFLAFSQDEKIVFEKSEGRVLAHPPKSNQGAATEKNVRKD